ncbi:MAG TPA: O-antigen polysaccharide polymerase Wzy [Burkholderiaceae bacterium]|nr:O-antigen polysaccharide polymerase Wzy [Burkholderiaceae bacterium]
MGQPAARHDAPRTAGGASPAAAAPAAAAPLFMVSVALAIYALVQCLGDARVHAGWPSQVSAGCVAWYLAFVATCWRRLGTVYSFTNIYVIGLGVFHLGLVVPLGLDLFAIPSIAQDPWYERAAWYTALALGCLGAGFALSLRSAARSAIATRDDADVRRTKDLVRSYGIGLLLASLASIVLMVNQLGDVFRYARLDLFSGAGDVRGFGLFTFTLPSAAILLVIGARRPAHYAFAAIVCAVGFVLFMVTGYRTLALFPLLSGAVLWRRTGRRIPAWLATASALFVVVAIPAILELRSSTTTFASITASSVGAAFGKARAADAFRELGSTVGVLAKTLELVPDKDPYRYGMSYVQAAGEMLPNVTTQSRRWDRDIVLSKSGAARDEALRSAGLSTWISYRLMDELTFSLGYGAGFTAIGEPYVNFGMLGVVAYFGALGYMLGRLDQKPLLEHAGWLLFACVGFWHFTNTVRNDMPNFTKPLAFIYVCLLIWRIAMSVLRPTPQPAHG